MKIQADLAGRRYPKKVIEDAIQRASKRIQSGHLTGSYGNRARGRMTFGTTHVIHKIEATGDNEIVADVSLCSNEIATCLEEMARCSQLGLAVHGPHTTRNNVVQTFTLREVHLVPKPLYRMPEPDVITVLAELAETLDEAEDRSDASAETRPGKPDGLWTNTAEG